MTSKWDQDHQAVDWAPHGRAPEPQQRLDPRHRDGRSASVHLPPTARSPAMPRSPSENLEPSRPSGRPRRRAARKRRPVLNFASAVLTALIVAAIGAGVLAFVGVRAFEQPGPLTFSTVVSVEKGSGLREIADMLEDEGAISDARVFIAGVYYLKLASQLKAGEYALPKGASMRQVVQTLVAGRTVAHRVPVPEGLTSEQIVARLNADPVLTGEITIIPAEGTLLPDTYQVSRGMDRNELLARMAAAQTRYLEKIWAGRQADLPITSKAEAIVLASIVEKETSQANERARVAGVFTNRLRRKMRLQSDPTIIYGVAGGKGTLGRPILRSEINQKTAYNTYQIDGLPPGPICNPGREALAAVLQPEATKDLFFVADGTGGHVFAETYAEHQKNVAAWRKIEARLNAEREKREAEEAAAAKLAAATTEQTPAKNPVEAVEATASLQQQPDERAAVKAPAEGVIDTTSAWRSPTEMAVPDRKPKSR